MQCEVKGGPVQVGREVARGGWYIQASIHGSEYGTEIDEV